ncbi:MAG TPA: hypothetical protein VIV12_23105, partial [Streptosporangiaceae bacterium]
MTASTGRGTNPLGGARKGRGGVAAGGKKFTPEQAKKAFLDYIGAGYNIGAACDKVGRSRKTYEYWRKNDPDFLKAVDSVMATRKVDTTTREGNRAAGRAMGFAEWRQKYLGLPVFAHQQQWIDLLEGREPTALHPTQTYEKNKPTRLVVNTFPNAGKTTTLTIDYVTYRICINPAIKVAIISKTADMAADMVAGVKTRLTHPDHDQLIKDFAPEGGFEATAAEWSSKRIRLDAADRDPADKDPTLQALGLGSQVYGKRLDLVLVDDAIDGENAQHWQAQLKWLGREVSSRPGMSGRVVVIGTRISPADLYWQLRDGKNFQSGRTPWTYLSQPALLEDSADPEDWVTLWPRSTTSWWTEDDPCPCGTHDCQFGADDGTFPRFDGRHLSMVRDGVDADVWNQAYMQLEAGGNTTFPGYAIQEAVNKGRRAGREGGMYSVPHNECYIIGSLDPATSGFAFMTVGAVHQYTHKRYLYDAWNIKHPTPDELRDRVKAVTIEYGVHEWRIEKTGLLTMFTQDYGLNQWLTARGVRLTPHYTGKNKFDVNFGVASMSPLFGVWQELEDGTKKPISPPLLELPRPDDSDGIRVLIDQLGYWTPELDPKKTACDGVMALWFFECGARDRTNYGQRPSQRQFSGKTPLRDRQKAAVINLHEFRQR